MVSKKVILLGHFGVGKTSLIRYFVYQRFSEEYLTTLGVKIDKKVVQVNGQEVAMLIWDIAGEENQQKVPESYKLGAHGAIYVFDVTRPSSYANLDDEISHLQKLLPTIPIVLAGNKTDLLSQDALAEFDNRFKDRQAIFTSAKTGANVEEMFYSLARQMLS